MPRYWTNINSRWFREKSTRKLPRTGSGKRSSRNCSKRTISTMLNVLTAQGLSANQILHIGSHLAHDVVPARKLGMRTGLFAGDKASLQATKKQIKEPASRPEIMMTELTQIAEVVG